MAEGRSMQRRRSAVGASVLALLALATFPVVVFFATEDLVMALVGGLVGGSVTAYLILVVAMATQDCHGYFKGVARVFFGGDDDSAGASGYAGWGLAVIPALAMVGIVLRICRSADPLGRILGLAGFLVGAVAASFVLVVVVMAFGDLVDWLLTKRRR
jgi:hypothetical protein